MKEPKSGASLELGQRKACEAQSCFVVMPFGKKPRGPTQDPHDFEEIYRVVIERAIASAHGGRVSDWQQSLQQARRPAGAESSSGAVARATAAVTAMATASADEAVPSEPQPDPAASIGRADLAAGTANYTTLLAEAPAPAGDTPRPALCARPPLD
jgi:hypothetical protein